MVSIYIWGVKGDGGDGDELGYDNVMFIIMICLTESQPNSQPSLYELDKLNDSNAFYYTSNPSPLTPQTNQTYGLSIVYVFDCIQLY